MDRGVAYHDPVEVGGVTTIGRDKCEVAGTLGDLEVEIDGVVCGVEVERYVAG